MWSLANTAVDWTANMKLLIIIGAVPAVLAVFLVYRALKPGYRGAIGFKNRHAVEYAPTLQLEKLQRGE